MTGLPDIDLRMADDAWAALGIDLDALASRAMGAAAAQTGVTGALDLLLTDDAEIQALNARWRGKDKPTDILSFPAPETPGAPGMRHLGDVVLAFGTVARDAAALSRPMEFHLSHLFVHGYLHLLGHDHETPEDAGVMEPLEREILAVLGWPDPYGDQEAS